MTSVVVRDWLKIGIMHLSSQSICEDKKYVRAKSKDMKGLESGK